MWIQNARKGFVVVDSVETYAGRWTKWWNRCNPDWRERDVDGHPVIGGSGDWSVMRVPGKNGFILVIGGLLALASAVGAEDWGRSVRDVHWVLQETLAAVRENG